MAELNTDRLITLAREKSTESRRQLAETISDLFDAESRSISDRERVLMFEILHQIILDTEMTVRQIVGAHVATLADAPEGLVNLLANDDVEVAFPVLTESSVLRDKELIEIIRHRALEHQLAISIRHTVSEDVSEALVREGDENVILNLLRNSGAKISSTTMEYLVDESQRVNSFQEPILRREDLAPHLAKRMYMWVSAALRTHIVENFNFDKAELDDLLEKAALEASGTEVPGQEASKADVLAEELDERDSVKPILLIEALRDSQVHLFVSLFRRLTGLRQTLITRFILEPTGEGLAIACKATGFDRDEFEETYRLCGTIRSNNVKVKESDRQNVIALFDDMDVDAALKVVQHWRRDVDYLTAIREFELSRGAGAGLGRGN